MQMDVAPVEKDNAEGNVAIPLKAKPNMQAPSQNEGKERVRRAGKMLGARLISWGRSGMELETAQKYTKEHQKLLQILSAKS
jgi:hypothetical protein